MQKKIYKEAESEFITFSAEDDVITASTPIGGGGGGGFDPSIEDPTEVEWEFGF